jgi:hypothetical protein
MKSLRRGDVVTLAYILSHPDLDPSLSVEVESRMCPLQTAHIGLDDWGTHPEWLGTRWRYLHTTFEEVDVFHTDDAFLVKSIITVVPYHDPYWMDWWVFPTAFPRAQSI